MARYELVIETRGEDSSASATITRVASSLDKFGDAAARASARAQSSLGGFASQFAQIGSVFAGNLLAGAVTSGLQALGNAFTGTFQKAAESERVEKQLEAVLLSTNNAIGMQKDELLDLAAALQGTTTYDDEAVLGAENLLLTFTNIGKDVFPQATESVLNMSTAMGQDLKSSAIQLGKALQDPVEGASALRRVGVNLSDSQEALIKNLVKTGDVAGAQKIILQELATEFGGAAAAQADTFSGRLKQMQNAFGDLQEKIGFAFFPVLKSVFEGITPLIQNVITAMSSPQIAGAIANVQKVLRQIFNPSAIANAAQGFMSVISNIFGAIQNLIANFGSTDIGAALTTQFRAIGDMVNSTLIPALQGALTWIQTNLLPAFQQFAAWLATYLIPAFINFEGAIYRTVIPALVKFGEIIGSVLGPVLTAVIGILRDQVGPALEKIGGVLNTSVFPALKGFADWIGPKIAPLLTTLAQLIGLILVGAFQQLGNALSKAAQDFSSWVNNFGAAAREVKDWIVGLLTGLQQFYRAIRDTNNAAAMGASIAGLNSMFNELSQSINSATLAANDYNERVNEGAIAIAQSANAVNTQYNAFEKDRFAALAAANANKDFGEKSKQAGEDALAGATAAQQAAEAMSKVADKIRGMVEQALNPTTVDQRLQMTGNAWDEFRLRLEAVNSGTPLDQYGAAFVEQVRKMQQITGLALPDIAAKFKDFSLFANMDWLKGALESGAIDLEPIKARINEQIQQIIGQANLMKAAFDEVWAGLSQQTKIDFANALGLSPQAVNNATQMFQALSGTQAQTATTTVQGTATATSALNTALSNTQTIANNVTTALGNVPAKMLAVQNAETPFRETTSQLNGVLSVTNTQLKNIFDYLEKARGSVAQMPAALTALTAAFTEASTPMQAFNDNTLRPIANTLSAILDYMRGIIAAAPDFGDALSHVDVDSAIKPGSPSPLEITLGHILGHMEDIASVAPRTFGGAVPPPFGWGAPPRDGDASAGAVNGGSTGRQVVFTGNIYVQNPANFDEFMDEINRRVETIVINGD